MAKLYQGQPATSDTLLFTSERRYTHLTITCTNTTGTDATVTLNIAYQGAAAAASNQILSAAVIPANKAGLMELGVVLEKGDTIRGTQGTNGAVTVLIDGLNIEQDSHSRGSSFSFFPPTTNVTVNTGGGATSPLTTKGDVWGFSTVDARIPIGSNGQVLTADSGQALGLKWQAGASSPLTTKGDLWGFSTVDARFAVGTNGQILQADSAQTLGVRYATVSGDATIAVGGALTLGNVNANTGALGDALNALTITTNAKGLVTAVTTTAMEPYNAQSQASAATISYTTARVHKLTLTGTPVAITLSGATNGVACGMTIYLVQDGTGGRVVTWPGSVKWSNGIPPVLTFTANAIDIVVLESWDGGTSWFANLVGKAYA